jgi:hypothetical protein
VKPNRTPRNPRLCLFSDAGHCILKCWTCDARLAAFGEPGMLLRECSVRIAPPPPRSLLSPRVRNDAEDKNRSVGFSPGKSRMHLFNNGVFNRKPGLTTEDTEKEL